MTMALHYVDDLTDYRASLEIVLAMTEKRPELKPWLGGDAVEKFMREIQPVATDRYLFDICMPVPREMKKLAIWPKSGIDAHSCGIALANWLVNKKECDVARVALVTHWGRENDRIQDELKELKIDGCKVFNKNLEDMQGLRDWLGETA